MSAAHHTSYPLLALSLLTATLAVGQALCAAAEPPASQVAAAAQARPLISLMLPLDAPEFGKPALAVQQGCQAGLALAEQPPRLEVVRLDDEAARASDAWKGAVKRGARVVVGPLTRAGVSALAAMLAQEARYGSALARLNEEGRPLPPPLTLTLNAPEDASSLPPQLYLFGIAIEQEARAVARLAWGDQRRSAAVIQANNALAKRSSQAFAAEWLALGGWIADVEDLNAASDPQTLKSRLASADMIFLSADAREARRIRPYLGNPAAIYATSQVNDGRMDPGANVDLAGIRFVDMPWLLQPDHPAVMVYPRQSNLPSEMQRFYALGIDACRVANLLANTPRQIDIDGVTGRLRLDATATTMGSAVQREPLPGMFVDVAPPPLEGVGFP